MSESKHPKKMTTKTWVQEFLAVYWLEVCSITAVLLMVEYLSP